VYKPRPHRARPVAVPGQSKYTKRGTAPKAKKPQQQPRGADGVDPAAKAAEKRMKRDARRDQRRRALMAPDLGLGIAEADASRTATELRELHVGLDAALSVVQPQSIIPRLADMRLDDQNTVVADAPEPRLIVEALVVRKLALEEAFLDFGGFALEI